MDRRSFARRAMAIAALLLVCILAAALRLTREAPRHPTETVALTVTPPGASITSREGLAASVSFLSTELAKAPTNSAIAVRLADALLRQARVLSHAGLPMRAEAVLDRVIEADPSDYHARRMRATVYLSQHRFRDAIREAERCRALRGDDATLDGIVGDASIELGHYDAAFAAFDRMMARRPDAAVYARASYARELQGDLRGAIRLMTMADSATSAHDPEAQAWHAAQLGHLHLTAGDAAAARREYQRAEAIFPGHPLAVRGLAQVDMAVARPAAALARLTPLLAAAPSAADFAMAGDAYAELGQAADAERSYRLAEAMWTSDTPEPAQLARFLATRGWRLKDAVRMAEEAFALRQDIYTADALAWAYFRAGRLADARVALATALSTGSVDSELHAHASAILTARATESRPQ